jgi:hypothetical protein
LRAELTAVATKRWRGSAREIIISAIEHRAIFGTPLAEYLPEQLVAGRLALVGDAAHVASPMVGAGFSSGLEDGITLIAAIGRSGGLPATPASKRCIGTTKRGWHLTAEGCSKASRRQKISCVQWRDESLSDHQSGTCGRSPRPPASFTAAPDLGPRAASP